MTQSLKIEFSQPTHIEKLQPKERPMPNRNTRNFILLKKRELHTAKGSWEEGFYFQTIFVSQYRENGERNETPCKFMNNSVWKEEEEGGEAFLLYSNVYILLY